MKVRECEDCGEEMPKGKNRYRCENCGDLCCGYCIHHVHRFAALLAKDKERGAAAESRAQRLEAALQRVVGDVTDPAVLAYVLVALAVPGEAAADD